MQILKVSEMRLELEYCPRQWIIGLGLVCVVLSIGLLKALFEGEYGGAAIALVMLAVVGWLWLTRIFLTVRLTADQGENTLRITTVSLFGQRLRERSLKDLSGAEVETRFDESNSSPEPCLVLQFGNERHRMDLFKPDPADLLQAAESINTWLTHSTITAGTPGGQ